MLSADQILGAFKSDKLPRARFAPLDGLSVLLNIFAFGFIALACPLLVAGLLALLVWVTVDGGAWAVGLMSWRFKLAAVLAVGTLILVLGFISFVMIRAIFPRKTETRVEFPMPQGSQLALEFLVAQIAKRVGVRPPDRIILSCENNVAARWDSKTGEFSLMVGMPLVYCLSTTQLAGMIAHECGHFRQRAGGKAKFLIATILEWLEQVNTSLRLQRESFAATAIDSENGLLSVFACFAQMIMSFVLVVVQGLRNLGILTVQVTMRRAEFHADGFEIELCGSKSFRERTLIMGEVGAAFIAARRQVKLSAQSGRLRDDFPRLVGACFAGLTDQNRAEAWRTILKCQSDWSDFHPSSESRIEAAEQEAREGVFVLETPAKEVFDEVDQVCRELTFRFYDVVLGIDVSDFKLMSSTVVERERVVQNNERESIESLFGKVMPSIDTPLALAEETLPLNRNSTVDLWAEFRRVRRDLGMHNQTVAEELRLLQDVRHNQHLITLAELCRQLDVPIDLASSGFRGPVDGSVCELTTNYRDVCDLHLEKLSNAQKSHARLLQISVNLLSRPELCPAHPADQQAAFHQTWNMLRLLSAISGQQETIRELSDQLSKYDAVLNLAHPNANLSPEQIEKLSGEAQLGGRRSPVYSGFHRKSSGRICAPV